MLELDCAIDINENYIFYLLKRPIRKGKYIRQSTHLKQIINKISLITLVDFMKFWEEIS